MKKLLFLFIFLTSCSFKNTANYWKDNTKKNEVLDFNKEYNFEEYGTALEKYNDRTEYPNIN
tara:strand:+ start:435 stop:620 length:186 start_codon:yes stop_codon:yes gene_type:complete